MPSLSATIGRILEIFEELMNATITVNRIMNPTGMSVAGRLKET